MLVLAKTGVVTFVASTIEDGDFAVPRSGGESSYVMLVRLFMRRAEVEDRAITMVRPCHGARIARVDGNAPHFFDDTDGLVTRRDDVVLAVTGGDCPPVLVVDPASRSFALVHSGRQGTRLNIAGEAVKLLQVMGAQDPAGMNAWIGPGICREHYEVETKYADPFRTYSDAVIDHGPKCDLGLAYAITSQLTTAGVGMVETIPECTYDKPGTWFSYRRDKRERLNVTRARNHIFLAFAS